MCSTSGGPDIFLNRFSSAVRWEKIRVDLSFVSDTSLITSPSFSAPGRGSKLSPRNPDPIRAPCDTLRDLFCDISLASGDLIILSESKSGPAIINISPFEAVN